MTGATEPQSAKRLPHTNKFMWTKLCLHTDLYRYLNELKRGSAASLGKKLKTIPGQLRLAILPCSRDCLPDGCLSPELERLHPIAASSLGPMRPIRTILEFEPNDRRRPHDVFRNLLYVYPMSCNLTNRPGGSGSASCSARNISCRMQVMRGESQAARLIYGQSGGPEMIAEAYTAVLYHSRSPIWRDEMKIRLPLGLDDSLPTSDGVDNNYHLLFTFFHISCQPSRAKADGGGADGGKAQQPLQQDVETPVGYTWLPLMMQRDGISRLVDSGDYHLPVLMEHPPPNYSSIPADVNLPGKFTTRKKSPRCNPRMGCSLTRLYTVYKYIASQGVRFG